MYDDIDTELSGLEGDLEDLRGKNSRLREWGEESEELIMSLENDYINANTERLELRKELEALKLKYENGIVQQIRSGRLFKRLQQRILGWTSRQK